MFVKYIVIVKLQLIISVKMYSCPFVQLHCYKEIDDNDPFVHHYCYNRYICISVLLCVVILN